MSRRNQRLTAIPKQHRHLCGEEQTHLAHFLNDLCDNCDAFMTANNCNNCNKQKFAACQGRLPSFLYEFMDLVDRHLDNQRKLIDITPDTADACDHFKRHSRLMHEVEDQIKELAAMNRQGNTLGSIRQLYQLLIDLFGEQATTIGDTCLADGSRLDAAV